MLQENVGVLGLPLSCSDCDGRDLRLDYRPKVHPNDRPTGAVEVWLGCEECSATLWRGELGELMLFLNRLQRVTTTVGMIRYIDIEGGPNVTDECVLFDFLKGATDG